MGIDHPATFDPVMLQTSSTYTLQDTNAGGSSIFTFTTSAAATASGASNASASSSVSGGSSSSTSSGSTSSTTKLVGTLTASVSAAGKPTLAFGGKSVKTLKTGRYTISVHDPRTRRSALWAQQPLTPAARRRPGRNRPAFAHGGSSALHGRPEDLLA